MSGAIEASFHASATSANEAGARTVMIGSAVSGAASVSLAAQRWKGIAPNRTAMASAKAR